MSKHKKLRHKIPPLISLREHPRVWQKFYCTVCKMKTWTYHLHNGLNISKTKIHVRGKEDITNNI